MGNEKVTLVLAKGRLAGLLQATVSLNALEFDKAQTILRIADNINALRVVVEATTAAEQKLAEEITAKSVIAAGVATGEHPQAEFQRRRNELVRESAAVDLWPLELSELLDGPKKVTPGALAELMPLVNRAESTPS